MYLSNCTASTFKKKKHKVLYECHVLLQGSMPRGQAGAGVKQSVYAMSMDADAKTLAIGTVEPVIRILDARTGEKVSKLRGHTDNIRSKTPQS
jgi:hypothetical protein